MIQLTVLLPRPGTSSTVCVSCCGEEVGAKLIPGGRCRVALPSVSLNGSLDRFWMTMLTAKNCLSTVALPRRISHWISGWPSMKAGTATTPPPPWHSVGEHDQPPLLPPPPLGPTNSPALLT